MLLSGTQFSPSRIGAARTVCRPAVVIQRIISSGRSHRDFHGRVVIPHTFCSFAPPCPVLLFRTHFIPENNAVVIGSTIQPCWISVFCDFLYCYSAHILQFVEFRQGCYPQHNSKNLFSGVVICGTFYEKLYFSIPCCYGQHSFSVCRVRLLLAAQFRSAGFFLPGLLNAAHFLQSGFSTPVL